MSRLLVFAVLLLAGCPAAVVHREICQSYVACAKGLDMVAGSKLEQTYGDQSACWVENRQALACVEGCQAGIDFLLENKISCPVIEVK